LESVFYLNNLYDYYKELLTEKQKNYFEDYYFQNLTLSEMSENYNISRNAVHKQIKDVEEKLYHYEACLHLYEKKQKILDTLKEKNDIIELIEDWI